MTDKELENIFTERLVLRKFTPDDFTDYYRILNQEEVSVWLGSGRRKTSDDVHVILERFINDWKKHDYGVWAVVEKRTERLMGHCGMRFLDELRETELLYALDPKSWGKGYATEAASAAMEFASNKTDLKRVIALAKPENIKSVNVIEKLGFSFIGLKDYFDQQLLCYEQVF